MANIPNTTPTVPHGSSSFGKQFLKHLTARLPYARGTVIDNIEELNPKFRQFFDLGSKREELIKQAGYKLIVKWETNF